MLVVSCVLFRNESVNSLTFFSQSSCMEGDMNSGGDVSKATYKGIQRSSYEVAWFGSPEVLRGSGNNHGRNDIWSSSTQGSL